MTHNFVTQVLLPGVGFLQCTKKLSAPCTPLTPALDVDEYIKTAHQVYILYSSLVSVRWKWCLSIVKECNLFFPSGVAVDSVLCDVISRRRTPSRSGSRADVVPTPSVPCFRTIQAYLNHVTTPPVRSKCLNSSLGSLGSGQA